jgi:hypothetical protein
MKSDIKRASFAHELLMMNLSFFHLYIPKLLGNTGFRA